MSVSRVTSGGRITIPKEVRDSLGIRAGDHVVIVVDGDTAILRRVSNIRQGFTFIGSGSSGRSDISVNHDEYLAEDFL